MKIKAKFSRLLDFVKSNKITFYLWYRLYRKNRGVKINWFNKDTVFLIDGYPRSGNTFIQMLIKNVFGGIETVHHLHSIGAIKTSLAKGLPSFIIYRDPKHAVSSNYLKEYSFITDQINIEKINTDLLNYSLNYYIQFYRYVVKNDAVILISFDKLIREPESVIKAINNRIPSSYKRNENDILHIVSEIKDRSFGAKDKLGSSRPSEVKEKLKKNLIKHLTAFENLKLANQLYEKLKVAPNNV